MIHLSLILECKCEEKEILKRIEKIIKLKIPMKLYSKLYEKFIIFSQDAQQKKEIEDFFQKKNKTSFNDLLYEMNNNIRRFNEIMNHYNDIYSYVLTYNGYVSSSAPAEIKTFFNSFLNIKKKAVDFLLRSNPVTQFLSNNFDFNVLKNAFHSYAIIRQFQQNQITSFQNMIKQLENFDILNKTLTVNEIKALSIEVFNKHFVQFYTQQNKNSDTISYVYKRLKDDFESFYGIHFDDNDYFFINAIYGIIENNCIKTVSSFFHDYIQNKKHIQNKIPFINIPKTQSIVTELANNAKHQFNFDNTITEMIDKIPKFQFLKTESVSIKIEDIHSFYSFWTIFAKIVYSTINGKSVLLQELLTFINDSHENEKFTKKINVMLTTGTQNNIIAIFASIITLFNSIDFKSGSFDIVLENSITYFKKNANACAFLLEQIDNIIEKNKELTEILRGYNPVSEYEYVECVENNTLQWNISIKDNICLVNFETKKVCLDYDLLQLVSAKLNITMNRTKSNRNNSEINKKYDNIKKFVIRYQKLQKLNEIIHRLHELHINEQDASIEFSGLSTSCNKDSDVETKINQLNGILTKIDNIFDKYYNGKISIFTKEHIFYLFNLINNNKNGKNDHIITSIVEGSFIFQNYDFFFKDYLPVYKSTISKSAKEDEIFEYFMESLSKKFEELFQSNPNFKSLPGSTQKSLPYSKPTDEFYKILKTYLNAASIRGIALEKSHIYLMAMAILSLNPQFPQPNQMLLCTMMTTKSKIDSFFKFFNSNGPYYFVIISPIYLSPDLYAYLNRCLRSINNRAESTNSHIAILYDRDDTSRNTEFSKLFLSIQTNVFDIQKNNTSIQKFIQNFFKTSINQSSSFVISSHFIYTSKPRTGKTQYILKYILENNKSNHIYARILIDPSTTISQLIKMLNKLPQAPNRSKLCIHFNVDGHSSIDFNHFILNIAFFRSLNDGFNIPFVYRKNMEFFFEFGSRPSMSVDEFLHNVFPIGKFMHQIELPKAKSIFTYDEYGIVKKNTKPKTLKVSKFQKKNSYLASAAALVKMSIDENSFLKVNKSALDVRYQDYKQYYKKYEKDFIEGSSKDAYNIFKKLFSEMKKQNPIFFGDETPLISQICDFARIIYTFKGPILSKSVFRMEEGIGQNIRNPILQLLIKTAIANCGLPYIPPIDNKNQINESSDSDTLRLKRIKQYLKAHRTILAICNPSGEPEKQGFRFIIGENEVKDFLKDNGFYFNDSIFEPLQKALGIIGSKKWAEKEKYPDELFEVLSSILNLGEEKKNLFKYVMLILKWRSLDNQFKINANNFWKSISNNEQMNEKLKQKINDLQLEIKNLSDDTQINKIYKFNEFLNLLCEIRKNPPFKDTLSNSTDVNNFILDCERHVQNENSLMIKYTLTIHNITRFVHLIYRIYSKVPIVMMGETGSGKTFTMKFLAEIIGNKTELIVNVIDGSMTEKRIRKKLKLKFAELKQKRIKSFLDELEKFKTNNSKLQEIVQKFVSFIISSNNKQNALAYKLSSDIGTDSLLDDLFEKFTDDIKNQIEKYIGKKTTPEEEKQRIAGLGNYIKYNIKNILKKISYELPNYIFFFDEVNTAPCQWFLKEVIIDRYFNGEIIPSYISFACAVNPSREMKKEQKDQMEALPPIDDNSLEDDRIRKLVYKVNQMPESFIPYLFPADPIRGYHNKAAEEKECLFDLNPNSEFDISVLKIVESNSIKQPLKYKTTNVSSNNPIEHRMFQRIGDKEHFSLTDKFSISFDYEFFEKVIQAKEEIEPFRFNFVQFLSKINIFCCRVLFHEIYKDKSFSSMRDPERCINIMRWAYKFGIYKKLEDNNDEKYVFERLRLSLIIGISIAFWVRLPSSPTATDKTGQSLNISWRRHFLNLIHEFWTKLINSLTSIPVCHAWEVFKEHFKAPTPEEWENIIGNECKSYADLFVEDDECVSKNEALIENIWTTYICLMNNIPLWIIGRPGTSKSLAVNIVINNLMNHRSTNEKITQFPPIISQQFMCSNTTKTEMIKEQLQKIVKKGQMYKDNYVVFNQILEEIGHADCSRYKPLACLHDIIDNGFELIPNFHVPVVLIGLSNYSMDSAKLNRGILLLRSPLSQSAIQKTGIEIFESTGRALNYCKNEIESSKQKYQQIFESLSKVYNTINARFNLDSNFIGLRDYYGLIQLMTKILLNNDDIFNDLIKDKLLMCIRRNFSGICDNEKTSLIVKKLYKAVCDCNIMDDDKTFGINNGIPSLINSNIKEEQRDLKTPIVRHIIIATQNNAAFDIIFKNKSQKNKVHFFFNLNLSDFTDNEWASNELRKLVKIMKKGETAVFIGNNQCFNGLYDVFNLRYQNDGIDQDGNSINRAMIAFGGDSYPTIVNKSFRAIIILEENSYRNLPPPFLNRFEKFHLNFFDEINQNSDFVKYVKKQIKENFKIQDFSSIFGCYSEELFYSCLYLYQSNSKIMENGNIDIIYHLMFLSLRPASILFSIKDNELFERDVKSGLFDNSSIRSTLIHFLLGYKRKCNNSSSLSSILYKYWEQNEGIQAIIMTPSMGDTNILTQNGFECIVNDITDPIQLENRFMDKINEINERNKKCSSNNQHNKPLVLLIYSKEEPNTMEPHILHFESILEKIKVKCKAFNFQTVHLLILIQMDKNSEKLHLNQTITWPLIYLDSFGDNVIKHKDSNIPLGLDEIISTPFKDLLPPFGTDDFDNSQINFNSLVENSLEKTANYSSGSMKRFIENIKVNNTSMTLIKNCIIFVFQNSNQDAEGESIKIVQSLSEPPQSLLEYITNKISLIFENVISIICNVMASGSSNYLSNVDNQDIYILNELLTQDKYHNALQWMIYKNTPQICPIEARINGEFIGQIPLYTIVWDIALDNSNLNLNDLIPLITNKFNNCQIITKKINELFSGNDGTLTIFIGCYLLKVAHQVQVLEDKKDKFIRFTEKFILILREIYRDECLTVKNLLYLLTQQNIIAFATDLTSLFNLFPLKDNDDFDIKSLFPPQLAEMQFDSYNLPTNNYITTLEANIIQFLIDNSLSHLHNTQIVELYDIFTTSVPVLVSKSNQYIYIYNEDSDESSDILFIGDYAFGPYLLPILLAFQQFFFALPQLFVNFPQDDRSKILAVKANFLTPNSSPSIQESITHGIKSISVFLMKFYPLIDEHILSKIKDSMIAVYIDSLFIPYIGLIDDETPISE